MRKCGICGETDESKFYGHKKKVCGKCHNQYTKERYREKRDKVLEYMGGKCVSCGFDKFKSSLDIHHISPKEKDINFSSYRGWSWDRIKEEVDKCVLLCKNCHSAYHAGEDIPNIVK